MVACSKSKKSACTGPTCQWVKGKGCKKVQTRNSPVQTRNSPQFRNDPYFVRNLLLNAAHAIHRDESLQQRMETLDVLKSSITAEVADLKKNIGLVHTIGMMLMAGNPMSEIVKTIKSNVKWFDDIDEVILEVVDNERHRDALLKYPRPKQMEFLMAGDENPPENSRKHNWMEKYHYFKQLRQAVEDWEKQDVALLREMINAGASKSEVKAYITKRKRTDKYWTVDDPNAISVLIDVISPPRSRV